LPIKLERFSVICRERISWFIWNVNIKLVHQDKKFPKRFIGYLRPCLLWAGGPEDRQIFHEICLSLRIRRLYSNFVNKQSNTLSDNLNSNFDNYSVARRRTHDVRPFHEVLYPDTSSASQFACKRSPMGWSTPSEFAMRSPQGWSVLCPDARVVYAQILKFRLGIG